MSRSLEPDAPVFRVHITVAGYSGTPLPRKLGIAEGHRVAFAGAPNGFRRALGPLPDGAAVRTRVRGRLDVIVAFFTRRSKLERRFPPLAAALEPDGGLWIAWPKRSSGAATDLTEDIVREIAIADGMVDNKVCEIDDTWSGLRLVYRVRDRPPHQIRGRSRPPR